MRSDKVVAGVSGLVSLACAVAVGVIAVRGDLDGQDSTVAVLVVVAVLGALLAYRRGGSASSVEVDTDGILRLVLGGSPYTFDLSNSATQIEMVGTPGSRAWRIRVLRNGMTPVAISSRVVEPQEFTDTIRQWRPNL